RATIRMAAGATRATRYHRMPTRHRNACPRNSPRPRKPEVRATIATALKKGPKVPRMISTGAVDAETCPYWWLAATRGSQHNQEITNALIVKRIAAGMGASRGRINGRCNGPVQSRLALPRTSAEYSSVGRIGTLYVRCESHGS